MHPFTCRQAPAFVKPKATLAITVHERGSSTVSTGTLASQNARDIFVDYGHLTEVSADIYVMVPKTLAKPGQ